MPIDRDILKVWLWILAGLLLAWGAIIAIAWKYIS
jgi:hypothetical protein